VTTLAATVPAPITAGKRALSLLQIGAGWFPEFCAGGENVFYHLAKHLPDAGVAVRGLVVGSANVFAQSAGRVLGFAPRSAPLATRLWRARQAIVASFAAGAPDLVATHLALFALPALDKLRSRPLIVHFHGPWAAESALEGAGWMSVGSKRAIERLVYNRADRVIVLSRAFGEILRRAYGVDAARITVIPGGVDCQRFAIGASPRAARERLRWDQDRRHILAVRRLARRMGLPELISSMVEVRRKLPEARLLIAGRGDQEGALRRLIQELDLADSVQLLGFVPDDLLPWAYRAVDLTVVPSTELEGFGLITAESLAAGTPVLVSPVGGLPEAVRPLAPELVLEGCAPAHLASGIIGALSGTRPLPTSEQCRSYARERFDWPVIAAQTREAYSSVLG
jgi:glycosyltransferase involved in cell wall biosynthesis